MPHSKTPGGQQASEKFLKQEAQTHGLGADNAPGHTEGSAPGEKPVAKDSNLGASTDAHTGGVSNVGIDNSATNQPGEKGLK